MAVNQGKSWHGHAAFDLVFRYFYEINASAKDRLLGGIFPPPHPTLLPQR